MESRPVAQLVREMLSPRNRRITVALLTSAICLSAWHIVGNYQFWQSHAQSGLLIGGNAELTAAVESLLASVVLLGVAPILVVKLVLGDRLADYGVRLGNWRASIVFCVAFVPLIVAIGYFSAQSPAFQAMYPIDPPARHSMTALAWHLLGQIFWYAAWEFHFRGFLQHALEKSGSLTTGIYVQTLASTLAHFGRPNAEVFAAIIGGLLWGALAWRTKSLMASWFQHWLLGASLDFFICRLIQ